MNELIGFEYNAFKLNTKGDYAKGRVMFDNLPQGSLCMFFKDNLYHCDEPKFLVKLPDKSLCKNVGVNVYDIINEESGYLPFNAMVERFTGKIILKGENVYKNTDIDKQIFVKINFGKLGPITRIDGSAPYNTMVNYGTGFSQFINLDYDTVVNSIWKNNLEVEAYTFI